MAGERWAPACEEMGIGGAIELATPLVVQRWPTDLSAAMPLMRLPI